MENEDLNDLLPEISISSTPSEPNEQFVNEADDGCNDDFYNIPDSIYLKIFDQLNIEDLKKCRGVCQLWNSVIYDPSLLVEKTCFTYEGRRDDHDGLLAKEYFEEFRSGAALWDHLRIRRASVSQLNWIFTCVTHTITTLEILNCSFNWHSLLKIMAEFENLKTLQEVQDQYSWSFSPFNEGIQEDEQLDEKEEFKALDRLKLKRIRSLTTIKIHRNHLTDLVTYLKMLLLLCDNLEHLELTTDQMFHPRQALKIYEKLEPNLKRNGKTLQRLIFTFRHIYPLYDFRVFSEHHSFKDFLNYINLHNWAETLGEELTALNYLSLEFPSITLDPNELRGKLFPFLKSLRNLQHLRLMCINLEAGKEGILKAEDIFPVEINKEFGIFINDTTGIPNLDQLRNELSTVALQLWRGTSTDINTIVNLETPDEESIVYHCVNEYQHYSKHPGFKDYNIPLLVASFPNLTLLSLVDHNTRNDHRHSSEILAIIEDDDLQLILKNLVNLKYIQMVGNLTFATDSGFTGISPAGVKRLKKLGMHDLKESDITGVSFTNLKYIRNIDFRCIGIKVTDITPFFGFNEIPTLKRLHIYGSHQITVAGRIHLTGMYPTNRGCDVNM